MCKRCEQVDDLIIDQLQEINDLQQQVIKYRFLIAPLKGISPAKVLQELTETRTRVTTLEREVAMNGNTADSTRAAYIRLDAETQQLKRVAEDLANALRSRHCGCHRNFTCGRCTALSAWEQLWKEASEPSSEQSPTNVQPVARAEWQDGHDQAFERARRELAKALGKNGDGPISDVYAWSSLISLVEKLRSDLGEAQDHLLEVREKTESATPEIDTAISRIFALEYCLNDLAGAASALRTAWNNRRPMTPMFEILYACEEKATRLIRCALSRAEKKKETPIRRRVRFGPLTITISGPQGPSGKTTTQRLIANALLEAGYEVSCQDSSSGVCPERFERVVGSFHILPEKLLPVQVLIDVQTSTAGEEVARG